MTSRLCPNTNNLLISSDTEADYASEAAASNLNTLYLQWCLRKPYMLKSCQELDESGGPGTCANMQRMPLDRYQTESLIITSDIALDSGVCHHHLCISL